MSSIAFTRRMDAYSRCLVSAAADLPGGLHIDVNASRHSGMVELGLSFHGSPTSCQTWTEFTPDQARAIAAELLACANAYAVKGGA